MVRFALKRRSLLLSLVCIPWLLTAQEETRPLPISLDADSSSFDRKTGRMVFRGLRITQDGLAIEADEALANGIDFDNSEWRFSGNVRFTIDSATIEADTAEIRFEAHALLTAELRGDPAVFEDFSVTRDELLRGGANRLYYDHVTQTLQMSDGTWFNEGLNEIKGCDLLYDFAQERVTLGSSDCAERIQITIVPPIDDTEGTAAPPTR